MKNQYRKINRNQLRLGDLIAIVNSCARNKAEALATLNDLFESGRVCAKNARKRLRLQIG